MRPVRGCWTIWLALWLCLPAVLCGCATVKQSDTSRTGVEQLLVSSAIDRALNKIDWAPIRGAPVYIETKYLDCVDKNYLIVSLHQRLLANGCTLVDKAEESAVTIEVGSGAVGTDRQELFAGIPEISLPASQIALPRVAFFSRQKANGTAKLTVIAFDTKSKQPVINSGTTLARSDHKNWSLLGAGPVVSGSVPAELYAATGESESVVSVPPSMAGKSSKSGWFK
jgi:hypothetical protein